MRKVVIIFTGLIVLLSLAASLAGALSYGDHSYRALTTARRETVEVQDVWALFRWLHSRDSSGFMAVGSTAYQRRW